VGYLGFSAFRTILGIDRSSITDGDEFYELLGMTTGQRVDLKS